MKITDLRNLEADVGVAHLAVNPEHAVVALLRLRLAEFGLGVAV